MHNDIIKREDNDNCYYCTQVGACTAGLECEIVHTCIVLLLKWFGGHGGLVSFWFSLFQCL